METKYYYYYYYFGYYYVASRNLIEYHKIVGARIERTKRNSITGRYETKYPVDSH